MKKTKWLFFAAVACLALIGGILGGTATYWAHQPVFPLYGYIFDGCLAVVLVFSLLSLKRWMAAASDEFTVAKKRLATQIGLMTGFALFLVLSLLPHLFPHSYRAFLEPLGSPYEGFNLGQTFGMLPFAFGMIVGQVVSWMKYR